MSRRGEAEAEPERWVTKQRVAEHYGYTTRWVEQQQTLGMPSRLIGGQRRYRLSEVDAWLSRTYSLQP